MPLFKQRFRCCLTRLLAQVLAADNFLTFYTKAGGREGRLIERHSSVSDGHLLARGTPVSGPRCRPPFTPPALAILSLLQRDTDGFASKRRRRHPQQHARAHALSSGLGFILQGFTATALCLIITAANLNQKQQ